MPMTESQHYEYWANYYAGEAILLKCNASVHVEDFDDAVFWQKTFTHFLPDKKFNFIYHSLTPSGIDATGVSHCLKFKDYLNNQFFVCIDSDYRYLLQEVGISSAKFIFQTYTYSIENHICYKSKLNAIPEKCTSIANTVFDFEAFLLAYSNAVYEAFIWHLHFLRNGDDSTFSKAEFKEIIQLLQVVNNSDIDHNGHAVINVLIRRCTDKIDSLRTLYPTVDIQTKKIYFQNLGVTPDNTYLFVRGHNLFDLIVEIGSQVNNKLLAEEKQKLAGNSTAITRLYNSATPFKRELEREILRNGYDEIERIENEIIQFL
jgi:hypothetical protein